MQPEREHGEGHDIVPYTSVGLEEGEHHEQREDDERGRVGEL